MSRLRIINKNQLSASQTAPGSQSDLLTRLKRIASAPLVIPITPSCDRTHTAPEVTFLPQCSPRLRVSVVKPSHTALSQLQYTSRRIAAPIHPGYRCSYEPKIGRA